MTDIASWQDRRAGANVPPVGIATGCQRLYNGSQSQNY
jgi:hypothetical protein